MEKIPAPIVASGRTMMPDSIDRPDMRALVQEHFDEMVAMAAPEASGALHVMKFNDAAISLFSLREGDQLVGCGALRDLGDGTSEIKTMRVVKEFRGQHEGLTILDYLIAEAKRRGNHRVYLETGSEDFFHPARTLYRRRGFRMCGAFAEYKVDRRSVFMMLDL